MPDRICFRCRKTIEDKSNYYAFTEFNKNKIVSVDYAHRNCWDEFLKGLSNTNETMGMLRGMRAKLIEMGMLPKEEEIVLN